MTSTRASMMTSTGIPTGTPGTDPAHRVSDPVGSGRVDVPLAALARSRGLPEEPPAGTGDALRSFGPALAAVFDPPVATVAAGDSDTGPDPLAAAVEIRDALRAGGWLQAVAALDRFVEQARELGPDRLLEIHGRTFELAPSCVPYLSVHLFGEDSFQRARLMAGLAEAHAHTGFDRGPELPDHLAVVLRFASRMAPEEWRELVRFCLLPALPAMARGLEGGDNPYRHALAAVQALMEPTGDRDGDPDSDPGGETP